MMTCWVAAQLKNKTLCLENQWIYKWIQARWSYVAFTCLSWYHLGGGFFWKVKFWFYDWLLEIIPVTPYLSGGGAPHPATRQISFISPRAPGELWRVTSYVYNGAAVSGRQAGAARNINTPHTPSASAGSDTDLLILLLHWPHFWTAGIWDWYQSPL